jgi:hypothetical protein
MQRAYLRLRDLISKAKQTLMRHRVLSAHGVELPGT